MGGADFGVAVMGDEGVLGRDDVAAAEVLGEDEAVGFGGDELGDLGEGGGGLRR